ncbi:MAG: hypothetical protein IMW89_12850 [Ktedonobacteraceae bacterium]|nr:hypothetical protein [Ktedonobacteraceae bacterium]
MTEQIEWGNVTLVLDHPRMRQGYQDGRRLYYWQLYDWTLQSPQFLQMPPPSQSSQSSQPPYSEEPRQQLPISEVIGTIALPDDWGYFHLDMTDDEEGVEELLGALIGYLSGPLFPETPEELLARENEMLAVTAQYESAPER